MKAVDIACFPKTFLLHFAAHQIDEIWSKLPEMMQLDKDVAECRRCRKHYNVVTIDHDEFDTIIPQIKNCGQCKIT